jgi:TonB family protein
MAETLLFTPSMEETGIHDYPREKNYASWGMAGSFIFHGTVLGIVLWIAYLQHLHSLGNVMTATIVEMPIDQIQILVIDDKKVPPPTDNPLWIKENLIPKNKPPPPPPPKPKPKPKPVAVREVPRYDPNSPGLPRPEYPYEAYQSHIEGEVIMKVIFDGSGGVIDAVVESSSGSAILDTSSRHWILAHWHDPKYAGQVLDVPVNYQFPH